MLESGIGWRKVGMVRGKAEIHRTGALTTANWDLCCVLLVGAHHWPSLTWPLTWNRTDLQEWVQTPGAVSSSGVDVVVCFRMATRQGSRSRQATATPSGLPAQGAGHHRRDFHVRTPKAEARPQPWSVFPPPTRAQLILPLAATAAASVGRAPSARRPGIPVDVGRWTTSQQRRRPPTLVDVNG